VEISLPDEQEIKDTKQVGEEGKSRLWVSFLTHIFICFFFCI